MAHAAVDHLRVPRGRPVAPATGWRTQERASLDHLPRDAYRGLGGIEACFGGAAARINRHAARLAGASSEPGASSE